MEKIEETYNNNDLIVNNINNSINATSQLENQNENIISKRYQNQNNINTSKKNKTTQLFETLLGSKLILTENSNMIIEKPFTIFEILSIIHSKVELEVKMEIIEKLKMIILKHHSNSIILNEKSILKDSKSEINISFMNELIEILIENSREPKLIEELLNLLEIIINKSGTNIDYFWDIFQRMSKLCEKNKSNYDGTKFLLLLKIINKLFTKNIHDDINNPSKFIFFNNNTSELKLDGDALQSKNITLNNGFTLGLWVYPEKVNIDSTNKNITPNSTLFYIHTNKNFIIEATIENDKLYYFCGNNEKKEIVDENKEEENDENNNNDKNNTNKNVNDNKNNEEKKLLEQRNNENENKDKEKKFLCNIEYNKWTLFIFTHKPEGFLQKPQFILYKNGINDPQIIDYIYPNFGNQKINKLGICKGFTGLMSNVFMFNTALLQNKVLEELTNYKFGLYNEQNINLFKSYIEQTELHDKSNNEKNKIFQMFKEFFKSIIFIYSPCRIKDNNICEDLVNNINSELNINKELNLIAGIYSGSNYGNNIYHLGGVSIFLPIFDYIFTSNYNSPIILEEGIQILINIFKNGAFYIGNQVKEDKNFFRNIYYLIDKNIKVKNNINDNNNLFTKEIMLKLYDLGVILINNDKQKKYSESFFNNIFLNLNIIRLYPFSVQKELYKKLKELYINHCEYLYNIFDIKDILRTIIYLYDNNANYYCCEKHYRMFCEENNYDINNFKDQRNKIYNPSLLAKINDLLEIMKYILTNDKIITISQIENIILTLITEISPCLQISLIKLLQIIFNLNEIISPELVEAESTNKLIISMEKEYIKAFNDINGIEHLLYIISTSTLDVRYECLRLFYLICSSESWIKKYKLNIENEILPYICLNIFQIRKQIENNKINKDENKEFNINDILFTGKDDNEENNDNIKSEININEEIMKLKKTNTSVNENLIINNEKNEIEELKNENIIDIETIMKELSLPVNYIKNFSNKINDNYIEKIYIFLIQWLINRFDNPVTLDDDDEIYYDSTLIILMNFVSNNGLIIKSKFLRDLYTLSHYNLKNCKILLENKYFHQWLLDILLIYEILYNNGYKEKTISQKGICESIIYLGIKLHNTIIINATLYEHNIEQENNSSSINNYTYIFQFLITWLYKIKKIGNIQFISAYNLVNNIISDLIKRLKPMLTKDNLIQNSLIWTCFLNISLIAYEFYYIHDYCINKKPQKEYNNNLSNLSQNLSNLKKDNKNIEISFVLNEEVLYNIENTNSLELINHNKILLSFYECFKIIWDAEINEININDDINANYQVIENFLDTYIFGQKINEYSLEVNILLYSTEDLPFQDCKTHNIMKTILDIIILFIKNNKNEEDIIYLIILYQI